MTIRSLFGVCLLIGLFLVVGAAVVRAARPGLSLRGLVRLAGLAYLVGLASLGTTWTLLLIVGVPFGPVTMLASAAVIAGGAIVVERRRTGVDEPDARVPLVSAAAVIPTALGLALIGLVLEVLFRLGRLHPLSAYDGWAFWIPKARVIFDTGELDPVLLTSLPNANYPPLLPIVDAAGFHAMGSADVVTLHLLHWTHAVAFLWAVAALLAPRVRPWLLWPTLVLCVSTPRIVSRILIPEADLLLQYLVVVAVVLIALWLREQRSWQLALAGVLLVGASLTKREGIVFAGCLLLAAALASTGRFRHALPRLGLVLAAVVLAAVPWRIWYVAHDVRTETPPLTGTDLDRAWQSLRLSWNAVIESGWGLAPTVALLAVVIACVYGWRRLALFQALLLVGFFLASAYATYGFRELAITLDPANNPILRLTAILVLSGLAVTPLLLESSWKPLAQQVTATRTVSLTKALAAVAVVLLVYPVALLAQGGPKFPTRAECARPATSDDDGQELELVFGRFASPAEAQELRDKVVGVGFVGTEVSPDGCGLWKVSNDGIDSFAGGEATAAEARQAGFDPRVEIDAT